MKIVLDSQQQQESINEQQQFVIIQSQSLAPKQKASNSENEEYVYVFKDEMENQEQLVWISNEQANDGTTSVQQPTAVYTIKEMNFAQDITNSTQSTSSDNSNDSSEEKMTIEEADDTN